jgi:hypothetical protein
VVNVDDSLKPSPQHSYGNACDQKHFPSQTPDGDGRPSGSDVANRTERLRVVYKDPAGLRPRARNPRTHSKKQIRQIANSIKEFGFINAVLIDAEGGIIAGHGRVEAAKLLHLSMVPTVCVDYLTPTQLRADVITDNKLAENAGWDRELLRLELGELSVNLDFDVTLTGFETAEIDFVLSEAPPDAADKIPEITSKHAVTRPGDLWHIGKHVLLCGDARNQQSYTRLLDGHLAEMICIDPPFNVAIDGHVCGLGKVKHREFQMAVGEMSGAEFTDFLHSVFKNCVAHSSNGSLHFVFMDWRHITEVTNAAAVTYAELKDLCVWAKTNAGMGSLYRSQHELVFVFKNGTAPHINNIELGKHARNRRNLWTYAGINSFG